MTASGDLKCAINNGNCGNSRRQFSSCVLFISAIIIVNLCPFYPHQSFLNDDFDNRQTLLESTETLKQDNMPLFTNTKGSYLNQVDFYLRFVRFLLPTPAKANGKMTTFMQAEAKVLGKMAKMWYIKKKIKKFSKKLKKHTIAVPVFTAIPIYEHPYYPQHHLAHHVAAPMAMHHHAAASSYSPVAVSQMAAAAAVAAAAQQQTNQQHIASASNRQQQIATYRQPSQAHQQHQAPTPQAYQLHHTPIFHPIPAANTIINAYVPSPPLFVDEAGSLYGHFGNAYGRYDGGYQLW